MDDQHQPQADKPPDFAGQAPRRRRFSAADDALNDSVNIPVITQLPTLVDPLQPNTSTHVPKIRFATFENFHSKGSTRFGFI